jgi:hypothetical protein
VIFDKHKCIFIHIPKSAGSSINYALGLKKEPTSKKDKMMWKHHATALSTKKNYASKEQWNNYFKFAIVRNPFDRIVSSYNFICKKMTPSNFRDRLLFKDFIYKKGIFKKLLNPSLITKKENRYVQIKSSSDFITDKNNNIIVDYVGRFENLKDDWNFICKQLGAKIELPHMNKCSRDCKHYRDYYDDDTKEFVSEACKKDLKTFGYKF